MSFGDVRTLPIPVPNANRLRQGWRLNPDGVFYICALESLAWDGPQCPLRLLSGQVQIAWVEEVVSPVVDHSLHGTFEWSKLSLLYSVHYYHAVFEIFILPSESLTHPSQALLQEAINSCIQAEPELFLPEYDQFPNGAQRYLRCFVHPMPLPMPSPEPIPFPYPSGKEGWTVGKTLGEVFIRRLDLSKWSKAMKRATMDTNQAIAECVCVQHWKQHLAENISHGMSGSIGVVVLHELASAFTDFRYHDRFEPAGPMYPPGAVWFFCRCTFIQDGYILLQFNGHPFRCLEDDDGISSDPEEFYSENDWDVEEAEDSSTSASEMRNPHESPLLHTSPFHSWCSGRGHSLCPETSKHC
ncbi:uncharacterized protein EI90DRAFT_3129123 [Cantharellus anzutake]|uniref:uncharacterized protein n=1 Tax=Cantharellus anzutake TaxID=1750568 RepID=UPI00190846C6|nr:uncharacterized protein EI90DRAFT_3129123 [Cantharellus anzutake]KAF8325057.1 hypothetical protein EI90DRAFT_3129123 [Cantharellus anzutake]